MNALEIKNLNYSYNEENQTLCDVSFSVKKGQYVSILGHNGSGKSTLAKIVMGLMNRYQGEVYINGNLLSKNNISLIRKDIAMVFQNPDNQFIGTTVEDDIAFGLENNRIPNGQMVAIVHSYAEQVGMQDYLTKSPSNLSGGQKQRVAIAGVLALNPNILILDEATSMLDPKGKKEINELISKIRENHRDLTVISITHDIEEAFESDEIIVLNKGKLVIQDNPKNLIDKEDLLKESNLYLPFRYELIKSLNKVGYNLSYDLSLKEIGEILCRLK